MVAGHLPGQEEFRDGLQDPHDAVHLALGYEVHPCSVAVRLERPGSVDRIGALDDVDMDAPRPVELGELDDLLELLAARRLCALANTRTQARRLRRSVAPPTSWTSARRRGSTGS